MLGIINVKAIYIDSYTVILLLYKNNTEVLLRWNNVIIKIILQVWQGHRHFYCKGSVVLERQAMMHAKIAKETHYSYFLLKIVCF